jgi:hypothetical protein
MRRNRTKVTIVHRFHSIASAFGLLIALIATAGSARAVEYHVNNGHAATADDNAGSAAEYVKKIMGDLMEAGYDGGFSIEPHLGAIIHEDKRGDPEELYEQYIQYGSNLNVMFEEAKEAAVRAV